MRVSPLVSSTAPSLESRLTCQDAALVFSRWLETARNKAWEWLNHQANVKPMDVYACMYTLYTHACTGSSTSSKEKTYQQFLQWTRRPLPSCPWACSVPCSSSTHETNLYTRTHAPRSARHWKQLPRATLCVSSSSVCSAAVSAL